MGLLGPSPFREYLRAVAAQLHTSKEQARSAVGTPHVLPSRSVFKQACYIWLATRVTFLLVTYFAQLVTVSRPGAPGTPLPVTSLEAWQHYDANWYLAIASSGYTDLPRAAFFPLYPLGVAFVHVLSGGPLLLAGLIVSNFATLAAFVGIGLLAANEESPGASSSAVRAFAAYPLALFTFAPYADGLFVACAVFALYFARRGAWFCAAGCAFLAALTRPTGIVLVAPLAWEYARHHSWGVEAWRRIRDDLLQPRRLREFAALALAVPLALGSYAALLWWRYGDALAFIHVQAVVWHRDSAAPWQTLVLAWDAFFAAPFWSGWDARLWVDALPVALFIILTVASARRLPASFTLYMVGLLVVALIAPKGDNGIPLAAAGRYMLPAVPIFLLVGRWIRERPGLDTLLIGGGFALQALFTAYFLTGGYLI